MNEAYTRDPNDKRPIQPSCEHSYVDRVIKSGQLGAFTRLVIYCTKCGEVSYNKYM